MPTENDETGSTDAGGMSERPGDDVQTAPVRVLPETELLDDLDETEELEHAKTYAYRARKAGEELAKMGPVLSAFGERIRRLGEEVEEAVAYLEGRAYYDVRLHASRVLARSEQEAARILGEEASLTRWEPYLEFDAEIQRLPWTEEA